MPTPHNEAKKEDIAKTVIMPGDPARARYIAEHFLKDYKLVNDVRGMYAYTGYYKEKRLTVMAHGMGIPSAAIYSYELFNFYDVENIIRIGSCGTYTKDLPIKSVLLVTSSYSDTNYDIAQGGINYDILESSKSLNDVILKTSKGLDIDLKKGRIYTSDAFYTSSDIHEKMLKEHECLGVEMESFAIFYNAKILNKNAACLLTVSDSFVSNDTLGVKERETSFNEMITLALESSLKL